MPLTPPAAASRFATSLVPPPYEGIVVIHSSHVVRMGIDRLFAERPDALPVLGSFPTVAAASDVLTEGRPIVVILESQIPPGGALAAVARGVRDRRRTPIVALLGTDERALIPFGFCQAAVRLGGDSGQVIDAVADVSAGRTHLGAGLDRRGDAQDTAGREPLTPREVEMLQQIAFGGTSKELAATHLVSYETVKTHVASVMRKLGASTRAHAVAIGYEQGLLGPTRPLVCKSSIAWTRHREVMLFDTFAEAASDVLRYLHGRCGFDTWLLSETIGHHCASLESLGAVPSAVMKLSEELCSIIASDDGPLVIEDVRTIDVDVSKRTLFDRLGVRGYLGIPIVRGAGGDVVAGMYAYSRAPLSTSLGASCTEAVVDSAALLRSMVTAAPG